MDWWPLDCPGWERSGLTSWEKSLNPSFIVWCLKQEKYLRTRKEEYVLVPTHTYGLEQTICCTSHNLRLLICYLRYKWSQDQMMSKAWEYAFKKVLLLLLALTANLNIRAHWTGNEETKVLVLFLLVCLWLWASHFFLGLFLHLKTEGIGLDQWFLTEMYTRIACGSS